MDAHQNDNISNDESSLSSGVSDDSTDDGNGNSRRGGRGNFAVGVQRAPRYSDAEKRMLVNTYGKHFGQNILPDKTMQRIRRRFNKWLRTTGVLHNGQPLKRTRNGLRQQEQKLFAEGWTWRVGDDVPAGPPQQRNSTRKQKKLPLSSPAGPPVSVNDGWEGYEELRKQSLEEKHSNAPPDLKAMFAEADAAMKTIEAGDDNVVMSGALRGPATHPQARAHSPRVLGQPARPTLGHSTIPSYQAPPATMQSRHPAPRAYSHLVQDLEATMAEARTLHDQLFGPHRPGCDCKKPSKG